MKIAELPKKQPLTHSMGCSLTRIFNIKKQPDEVCSTGYIKIYLQIRTLTINFKILNI